MESRLHIKEFLFVLRRQVQSHVISYHIIFTPFNQSGNWACKNSLIFPIKFASHHIKRTKKCKILLNQPNSMTSLYSATEVDEPGKLCPWRVLKIVHRHRRGSPDVLDASLDIEFESDACLKPPNWVERHLFAIPLHPYVHIYAYLQLFSIQIKGKIMLIRCKRCSHKLIVWILVLVHASKSLWAAG
jgi:hypothetical protein